LVELTGDGRATGRGVIYLVERALDVLKMQPDRCTAVVQGFGNVGAVTALGFITRPG
jgi:glutamate dehydrogenase (NAD(P)+)